MTMSYFDICLLIYMNEAYTNRGRFIDSLKYDWLVMMSLDGAEIWLYHVTT